MEMFEALWKLRVLGRSRHLHGFVSRCAAKYFAEGTVRRVPFGPLRGKRFFCSDGVQFWMPLGLYERETSQWIISNLRFGDCFYDVGANVGYFSLLGSTLVGDKGQVIAFEPVSSSVTALRNQISANSISNIGVLRVALADTAGTGEIVVEGIPANSHLTACAISHADSQPEAVEVVGIDTLDQSTARVGVHPNVIKIDVEGAEYQVLLGADELLGRRETRLLIATHSTELRDLCSSLLQSYGYHVSRLSDFEHEIVATPS